MRTASRPGQKRDKLWIWPWRLHLSHFLAHWTKFRGLKKLMLSSETKPSWGTLYPLSHSIPPYICSGTRGSQTYPTPQRASLRTGRVPSTLDQSCDPSSWRSGERGEGVSCSAQGPIACASGGSVHLSLCVMGRVLEFFLSFPLGISSNRLLHLDTVHNPPPPKPRSYFYPTHSLADTSGAQLSSAVTLGSQASCILLWMGKALALLPPAVIV